WEGIQEVWLMGPGSLGDAETVTVDVAATFDRKIEALRCHASQLGDWDPSELMRRRAVEVGQAAGFEIGEAFVRVIRRRRPSATPKELRRDVRRAARGARPGGGPTTCRRWRIPCCPRGRGAGRCRAP